MTFLPLLVSSYEIMALLVVFLALFLTSLYLIGKNEKGFTYFLWLLIIIFLPIIGSVAYLLKILASPSPSSHSTGELGSE